MHQYTTRCMQNNVTEYSNNEEMTFTTFGHKRADA